MLQPRGSLLGTPRGRDRGADLRGHRRRCGTSATDRAARWDTPLRPKRRDAARASCWCPDRRISTPPAGVEVVRVRSAAEMQAAVQQHAAGARHRGHGRCGCGLHAGSTGRQRQDRKERTRRWTCVSCGRRIFLPSSDARARRPSPGRCSSASRRRAATRCRAAATSCSASSVDFIVANDISRSRRRVRRRLNAVTIIGADGEEAVALAPEDRDRRRDSGPRGATARAPESQRREPKRARQHGSRSLSISASIRSSAYGRQPRREVAPPKALPESTRRTSGFYQELAIVTAQPRRAVARRDDGATAGRSTRAVAGRSFARSAVEALAAIRDGHRRLHPLQAAHAGAEADRLRRRQPDGGPDVRRRGAGGG